MKKIILILATLIAQTAFADRSEETLAGPRDFFVINNQQENEINVFLSYTGRQMNHCGISLRAPRFKNVTAEALDQVVSITRDGKEEIAQIQNGQLIAQVLNPSTSTYGQFFIIKTRSGEAFNQVLTALSDEKVDVLVEVLPCH
jgi:hypothetical protein